MAGGWPVGGSEKAYLVTILKTLQLALVQHTVQYRMQLCNCILRSVNQPLKIGVKTQETHKYILLYQSQYELAMFVSGLNNDLSILAIL